LRDVKPIYFTFFNQPLLPAAVVRFTMPGMTKGGASFHTRSALLPGPSRPSGASPSTGARTMCGRWRTVKASSKRKDAVMAAKKTPTQVNHRSSETGEFVTEKFAKSHPRTTEREVIKHPERE
jgi:hypothetical protein